MDNSLQKTHFYTALQFCALCFTLAGINIVKETMNPEILTFRSVTLGTVLATFAGSLYHCYKGMKTSESPNNRSSFFNHNSIVAQIPDELSIAASVNSPAA